MCSYIRTFNIMSAYALPEDKKHAAEIILFKGCNFDRAITPTAGRYEGVDVRTRNGQNLRDHYLRKTFHAFPPAPTSSEFDYDCTKSRSRDNKLISNDQCVSVCHIMQPLLSTAYSQPIFFRFCEFPSTSLSTTLRCDIAPRPAIPPFRGSALYGYDGQHCVYPSSQEFVWFNYKLRVQGLLLTKHKKFSRRFLQKISVFLSDYTDNWCARSASLDYSILDSGYCRLYCTSLKSFHFSEKDIQKVNRTIDYCSFGQSVADKTTPELVTESLPKLSQ